MKRDDLGLSLPTLQPDTQNLASVHQAQLLTEYSYRRN